MQYMKEEWLAELKCRFGDDITKWAFVCPACGRITTLQEIKDVGGEPNDGYTKCIGRLNGKGVSGASLKKGRHPKDGCDWAAFGLFGTLGKGDVVVGDNGKMIDVFRMADAPNIE
ncbi:MAG: hypothetical protein LBS36_06695 [Oscillospiraceae bacterium]|jgi:hypothetical protein|nr:hypothetical protein [Oscillospiraceae bacterium]